MSLVQFSTGRYGCSVKQAVLRHTKGNTLRRQKAESIGVQCNRNQYRQIAGYEWAKLCY